jgi:hypothetical protein
MTRRNNKFPNRKVANIPRINCFVNEVSAYYSLPKHWNLTLNQPSVTMPNDGGTYILSSLCGVTIDGV